VNGARRPSPLAATTPIRSAACTCCADHPRRGGPTPESHGVSANAISERIGRPASFREFVPSMSLPSAPLAVAEHMRFEIGPPPPVGDRAARTPAAWNGIRSRPRRGARARRRSRGAAATTRRRVSRKNSPCGEVGTMLPGAPVGDARREALDPSVISYRKIVRARRSSSTVGSLSHAYPRGVVGPAHRNASAGASRLVMRRHRRRTTTA